MNLMKQWNMWKDCSMNNDLKLKIAKSTRFSLCFLICKFFIAIINVILSETQQLNMFLSNLYLNVSMFIVLLQ